MGNHWLWWSIAITVLLVLETVSAEFFCMMLALGASVGLVGALLGAPTETSLILASAVSLVGLFGIRPAVRATSPSPAPRFRQRRGTTRSVTSVEDATPASSEEP